MMSHSPLRQPATLLLTALFFFLLFFSLLHPSSRTFLRPFSGSHQNKLGLHVLVPTTSTNTDVCQLLLSASVLGYPVPSLLGWEGRGRFNGSESHLFKISETLFHLNTLSKDQDDDLVLLLDAFDVWLQLPPVLLIQRYQEAIAKQDRRLRRQGIMGKASEDGRIIRNRILFGADKFCWPPSDGRSTCDSAPESSLPDYLFGPHPESEETKIRPRYLNSGSVMGPVREVRNLLRAAMGLIEDEWDDDYMHKTSDQYYLNIIFEYQEAARNRVASLAGHKLDNDEEQIEFNIALDQESDAFQINNFYSPFVTWLTYNHSTNSKDGASRLVQNAKIQPVHHPGRLDRFTLADDILALPAPYTIAAPDNNVDLPMSLTWKDVMLATNTATGQVFPLYHMTGDKLLRGGWWPRMWFYPHGHVLLQAARAQDLLRTNTLQEHILGHLNDVTYVAARRTSGDVFQSMKARDPRNFKGGVYNDLGEYMRWDDLCGAYEDHVFGDSAKLERG